MFTTIIWMSQGMIQSKYMQLSFRLLLHALFKLLWIFTTGKAIVSTVENVSQPNKISLFEDIFELQLAF